MATLHTLREVKYLFYDFILKKTRIITNMHYDIYIYYFWERRMQDKPFRILRIFLYPSSCVRVLVYIYFSIKKGSESRVCIYI